MTVVQRVEHRAAVDAIMPARAAVFSDKLRMCGKEGTSRHPTPKDVRLEVRCCTLSSYKETFKYRFKNLIKRLKLEEQIFRNI